jgi:hypothetical protein
MECFCDYDPPIFAHQSNPVARTRHSCSECHRVIEPGEKYERLDGMWDRHEGATTFKTCPRCLALRDFVKAHVPCLCWAHGNTIEDCMNAVEEYAHETVGLRFGALRRLHAIRQNERFA